jgi:hypothetical protein
MTQVARALSARPPVLHLADGREITGRTLGFEDGQTLYEELLVVLETMKGGKADFKALRDIVTRISRAVELDPKLVMSLPPVDMIREVMGFFTSGWQSAAVLPDPTSGNG